jgi:hypothetical protein
METAAIYQGGNELSAYPTAGVDGFISQKTTKWKVINSLKCHKEWDIFLTRYVSNYRE